MEKGEEEKGSVVSGQCKLRAYLGWLVGKLSR